MIQIGKKELYIGILSLLVQASFPCFSNFNHFAIFSVPKTGTHLSQKALKLILKETGVNKKIYQMHLNPENLSKKSQFFHLLSGHGLYNYESAKIIRENNYKGFFCIRDPRDAIVSMAFWFKKRPYWKKYHDLSLEDRIKVILSHPNLFHKWSNTKNNILLSYSKLFSNMLNWGKEKNFLIIKFEDLIGPKGNGSLQKQLTTVQAMAQHINIKLSNNQILNISNNLFGNTATFRAGQIGKWKKHFTKEHKLLAKKHFGQILIKMGYENDTNW